MSRPPPNHNHGRLSVDSQASDDQFHVISSDQVEIMDTSSSSDTKATRVTVDDGAQMQSETSDPSLSWDGSTKPAHPKRAAEIAPTESSSPLAFMKAIDGQEWKFLTLDSVYVPKIGSCYEFYPKPKTKHDPGNVLLVAAPCGRGKSYVFREYMCRVLQDKPSARVLLLSANILYGTNLSTELQEAGFDVGFYKDADVNLASHHVVVCSLESLHHVEGQRFDLMLIDEVRTIGGLVGGETMPDFTNVFLLRDLCATTPQLVMCDADTLYTADKSEPVPAVKDFIRILAPERAVVCATFTDPGPSHLKRSARLFHDCPMAARGSTEWWKEVERAAGAWRDDKELRFAVCVGSKKQMREVCTKLKELKVPFKPYSGDTHEKYRLDDLKRPDECWLEFGGVVSTTTLSIGVDPQSVQFARVFIWTCRMGCNVLTQAQAALRFGRGAKAPLLNPTIDILIDGMPPGLRSELVTAGKRDALVVRSYDAELERLHKRRAKRVRLYTRQMMATGGFVEGIRQPLHIADDLLRLMAHGALERGCQMSDLDGTVRRVCQHHEWKIVNEPLEKMAALKVDDLPDLEVDEDDMFAALMETDEKFEWILKHIQEKGEEDFFDSCYGLVDPETGVSNVRKSSREQWLVKTFWLLRQVGRLAPAETLVELDKPGVKQGVELNALSRCRTPEQQMKQDRYNDMDPSRRKRSHYMNKVGMGSRMLAAAECAELLELDSIFDTVTLPDWVIDMVNRERAGSGVDADRAFAQRLSCAADALYSGTGDLLDLLEGIARACGMKPEKKRERKQKNGSRKQTLVSIDFTLCELKSIVDDWLVKSERLNWKRVRVADWQTEHAQLDQEEMELGMLNDAELDEDLHAVPDPQANISMPDTRETRTEKIDGAALATELGRLQGLVSGTVMGPMHEKDKRWFDWLQAADAAAEPKPKPNEPPPAVRYLTVTYAKKRVIGRRTASHPSNQHCPSGLRPLLVMFYYHDVDIVNCHPTLFLQVAKAMNVPEESLARLLEYVENRKPMLERIGAFYGVPAAKCKYAVLRVLNGGSLMAWIRDAHCTRNQTEEQTDLRELQEIVRPAVMTAFFTMPQFKPRVAALTSQVQASASAKVAQAKVQLASAVAPHTRVAAQKALRNATHKASAPAVRRSVFSLCVFELEDMVLDVIDGHLRSKGWTVASLEFDGLKVEHRGEDICVDGKWRDLENVMREAEAEVQRSLGYRIQLTEKALFQSSMELDDDDAMFDDE